jgi:FdhE protein
MEYYYPPSMDRVTKEVEFHLEKNKNLAQIFEVYKGILAVQLDCLDKIKASVILSEKELKEYFRNKKFLMSDQKLEIESKLFREILGSICKAIKKASPEAPESLLKLSEAEELDEENIQELLQKIALYNKQELEYFIEEKEIDKKTELNSEIIAFVIFMSLSPFYSANMKEVREKVDFSSWRQSYCPVCGQTAVIAKHRSEDGARVLECWLCHAEWVYPRMECPYCNNSDQKKLRFFYVTGDKARQVHVCEKCKRYLKTIDSKIMEKDVLLDIEAIATSYLDELAKREGYKPPKGAVVLN